MYTYCEVLVIIRDCLLILEPTCMEFDSTDEAAGRVEAASGVSGVRRQAAMVRLPAIHQITG